MNLPATEFIREFPVPPNSSLYRDESRTKESNMKVLKDGKVLEMIQEKPIHGGTQGGPTNSKDLHVQSEGFVYEDVVNLNEKRMLIKDKLCSDKEIDRSQWSRMAQEKHPWIKELRERLYPLERGQTFSNLYLRLAEDRKSLDINNMILQHLLFEGLRKTKSVMCEELKISYTNIDVDGSMLFETVKEGIRKTEALYDAIMSRNRKNNFTIEQMLHDFDFQEEKEKKKQDTPIYEEVVNNNVIYNPGYYKTIKNCSLNVLMLRVTLLDKLEYFKLEQFWEKNMKKVKKNVNILYPDVDMDLIPKTNLLDVFLTTFPSFTTQTRLLDKIIQRFDVPSDHVDYPKIQLIQKTIFRLLFKLVSLRTFKKEFIDRLLLFLKEKEELGYFEAAKVIKQTELHLSSHIKKKVDYSDCPKTLYPHHLLSTSFVWHEVNPEELARQITLIDQETYQKIRPTEFLGLAWSKPHLKHRAPNLLRFINQFNRLSRWVSSVIIAPKKLSERRHIYGTVLAIMKHLKELGNYNSLMAFLLGIGNHSVTRLKKTISSHTPSLLNELSAIRELLSIQSNHVRFRNALRQRREAKLPTIPYLGFGQGTLTYAEEGNEDFVPNATGGHPLINWEKRVLIHGILDEILHFQSYEYYFRPVYQIQVVLHQLKGLIVDDKVLHETSLEHGNEADASKQNFTTT